MDVLPLPGTDVGSVEGVVDDGDVEVVGLAALVLCVALLFLVALVSVLVGGDMGLAEGVEV